MPGESLDFFNPFISATIITVDGQRFPLWLKTDPAAQSAARLPSGPRGTSSLSFVSEFTVEMQLAYLPIIKVTLTPPYSDAINFLDSRLIEWGQSQLEIQFGYLAKSTNPTGGYNGRAILSPVYTGILLKPEVQLGQDVVITLSAQGVGGFAAVRQEGNLTVRTTRKKIVTTLMARFGVEIDDSEISKVSATQEGVVAEWSKKLIDFSQSGDTYWTAVLKVIREAGFHSYLLGNTLKILPASFVFSSAPTKLFRLYDFSGGRLGPIDGGDHGPNRVYPILSASSPTAAIYLPGSSQGFFCQDVNSFSREEIKKLVGEDVVTPPRTDQGAAAVINPNTLPAADTKTGEGAEMFPGDPSNEQFVQQLKSEYAAQSTLMGVQLSLETLGDPSLMPGTVLAVRGLGARLSGNYSTLKVTNTINSSGYAMTLEVVSNVAQALENTKKALGPIAPQPTLDETGLSGSVTIDARKAS